MRRSLKRIFSCRCIFMHEAVLCFLTSMFHVSYIHTLFSHIHIEFAHIHVTFTHINVPFSRIDAAFVLHSELLGFSVIIHANTVLVKNRPGAKWSIFNKLLPTLGIYIRLKCSTSMHPARRSHTDGYGLRLSPVHGFHPHMLSRQPEHDLPICSCTHIISWIPFHHASPSFAW